jgi:AhpD family alkylhydroperoxidase
MVIRHLAPIPRPPAASGGGLAAAVFAQIEEDFGFVAEPFLVHAPVPELLAAAWSTLRETVLVPGRLRRPEKEAVAMAVSAADRCPYCVDAHGLMLHATGEGAAERAIHAGRPERIADRRLAALAGWAAATGDPGAAALDEPPFSAEEAPEAIGTALCFKYINRIATILLGTTPLPTASSWLRRPILRLVGRRLAPRARRPCPAGESLRFLPAAEPPAHLAWAAASPRIAQVFARFDAAVERAAAPVLSLETRTLAGRRLALWRGEAPPFGDAWLRDVAAGLPPAQRAAARLALLAAVAPYRVDDGEVAAFRAHRPDDASLLAALAWGSFHAARRVSEWLPSPAPAE